MLLFNTLNEWFLRNNYNNFNHFNPRGRGGFRGRGKWRGRGGYTNYNNRNLLI